MKTPSTTLVQVLIGKSILELLFVGALALFAFMTIVPPTFHGSGELTEGRISGWVVNDAAPWDRVEVELFLDGKFLATTIANQPRPNVFAAGWAKDQWHGYTFPLPSSLGLHEVRLYALNGGGNGERKSLQLIGSPLHYAIDGGLATSSK